MARRVFFSFKYEDVSRAMVVRNSWVTQGKEAAGFIDAADFEGGKEGHGHEDDTDATDPVGERTP